MCVCVCVSHHEKWRERHRHHIERQHGHGNAVPVGDNRPVMRMIGERERERERESLILCSLSPIREDAEKLTPNDDDEFWQREKTSAETAASIT